MLTVVPPTPAKTALRTSRLMFTSPVSSSFGVKDERILVLGTLKVKSSKNDKLVPGGKIYVKLIGEGIVMSKFVRFKLSLTI